MSLINALLRTLVDGLLYPFRDLSPIVGLTVVSLLTAIGLLIVFKHTSNQKALEDVKRKIHAGLFEIRLYNDDFRAIMRAQRGILRANLTYMRYSMAPMIWTLPPLILLIAQLQFHYGYAGLTPGQEVLLKVEFSEGAYSGDEKPPVTVTTPEGLQLDDLAVWIPTLGEMAWRLTAAAGGDYELEIRNGAAGTATKTVTVTDSVVRRSPFKVRGFLNELIYPAEASLPSDGTIEAITVTYPEANVDVFGFELHWMIVYFVLSMLFAFILRGPFGVTI
jgi:uncharacterized membrane protein (DUF106 family)